ncbi:cysteine-tryptophan domain-containing zinc finger protein 7 isoform X2 [Cornus florida]|uniref:cysteine-tryptophan domain-containing zinc finger protein 7 isoform X2 n=1 Tax=Cornus florida TaxID=4283 RepID=UPI0028A013AC|nr:cysteine-tryptophan domain-containing zinc finger protein 7 isoform X2 [Cornus florida]
MISVGSRDARKGLGLGFVSAREMEETELEEGEAYQNDEDSSIDPDIALSYIDVKLQDVLGHFQKDFEGGVSAENLGAKFGGYGSFLPSYQRSPVWSHTKTPPKVHNYNTPRSPKNLHLEGGRHNSVALPSASLPVRLGQASTSDSSLPLLRPSTVNDSVRRDVCMSSTHAEESTSQCELMNNSTNTCDQKTLKVRIKVGSDNLPTRKNAEIYSGLGLDVSPSSSLDDSPSYSEGLSHEAQFAPDESPTSILQSMTSFPVPGGILLSPLPADLICFTAKEKLRGESRSGFVHKGSQEGSAMLVNGSDSARADGKVLGDKKPKSSEKNASSVELKNLCGRNAQNGIGVLLKKETGIDAYDCEQLVSNALKLPLLSISDCNVVDSAKGTTREFDISKVVNKSVVKDESIAVLEKEEPVKVVSTQDIGWAEKPNGNVGTAGKVWEEKKGSPHDNVSVCLRKDSNFKGEKNDSFAKADSNVFNGRKTLNAEHMDHSKHKTDLKATSHEEDGKKLATGKEYLSSGGKKKSKGSESQRRSAKSTEVPKDSLNVDSSLVPKNRKGNNYLPKSEVEDVKLQKDYGKSRDTYRDFFGELELDQGDKDVDSVEMPSADGLKDAEVVEKSTFALNSTSKERLNGRKIDKLSTSDVYPKVASNVASLTGNGAGPGTVAPVVKEDWVCCDKCQTWRLLPHGTNPDSLPEKWLCSMLDWLPGMNRCSFSEEETTKALIALYHVPAPESQNNRHDHLGGVVSGVTSFDARHFGQHLQNFDSHIVPSGGKKKHGLKEVSNATNQDGIAQFPNSRKNLQASVKSRSLNGGNQSPTVSEREFQQVSKSGSIVVEKQGHKQKEKNKLHEHYSNGGDTKSSKMKSKREEADQDYSRAYSKKIKIDGMRRTDEDWMSDHGEAVGKVGPSSSSGLSINESGKDRRKYNDHSSSKDSKCDAKNSIQVPTRNPPDQVQFIPDDGSLHKGNCDDSDIVPRKRKMNECQDTQIYAASLPGTGHHLRDSRDFVEETSENDHKKDKKARVSKSEGKETSKSKVSGGTSRKSKSVKNQHLGPDLGSTLSQRDLGSVQPSVAATSSSSKVSGSHKNKASLQEVKGSPVESVSSSPLRILNPDKSTLMRKNLALKDDFQDAGFFATGSPRRCSDGEDDRGSDRSGTINKDKTFTVTHHRSAEPSVLEMRDGDMGHAKAKAQITRSPEFTNFHFTNGDTSILGQGTQYPCKPESLDQCHNEERGSGNHYIANASRPRKSGKGSSSRSKEKKGNVKSEFDKGKIKISDSYNESTGHKPREEKSRAGKNRFEEKFGFNSEKFEKNSADKKDSAGKLIESSKKESQPKLGGHDGLDGKVDAISSQEQKQNLLLDRHGERSSKRFLSEKVDREVSGRGKSHPLPPTGRGQNETGLNSSQLISGSQKENGANILSVDVLEGDDALKVPKHIKKSESQNGNQSTNSRHPTPNGHKVRDVDAPSPVRRDSSSQAATNALKEAKDLKHLADRLKASGSNLESTVLYFQAALKFLHGASLLESCNSESAKHGEMIQSMHMYSSTAKLCEFCAHEFEKFKDAAAAALAYKCMEVAYMRVIYSSHTGASRDRHELQMALQVVPPGESPSSSASDVDNLNNPAMVDKGALAKGVCSPQVAGNHVIAARNRSSFVRLLNFTQDVHFAMEASRKSQLAFAAASPRLEQVQYRDGIRSVKRALDFNFQDVEGLLRLVRLAMEAISEPLKS